MDLRERLQSLRHVALDLDGTLYEDGVPFGCTPGFLERLRALDIGRSFLTNNSSRSTARYVRLLRELEIDAEPEDICSSTHATLAWMAKELPNARRLFVLGTRSLADEFAECGFTLAGEDPGDPPDAVVVGYDTGLTFDRLCRAAYWIAEGKAWIATHPDRVCPTSRPTVLVDCGAICAALVAATGREPAAVPGKPNPWMLEGLLERRELPPTAMAMVGDRLYTDMAMARAAGVLSVLVLSGETQEQDIPTDDSRPDVVVRDVGELGELLLEARGART